MTLRFAFYGRVSTEDQQDPETSLHWQRTRAQALIEAHGPIVAEYFDIGQSRSLPWKRRDEATRLLAALKDPNRGFEAVVIGEPQRAFYGNQYSLTFPVFDHYGVGLWVPEVGGPIDAASEAHDLIMGVFGGMSKGERNRIKIRVRTAMQSQAQLEGRYLGGRPPYGYRLADAGPHPNPGKAADGKRLQQLEPDPDAAPVVQRIFTEYLDGIGIFAIAQRLTAAGVPCPSAHDPGRNRHRSGIAWSKNAVRTILGNPRYTGRQVWNKQRKHESLVDVDNVALGHETKQLWNDQTDWIHSTEQAHPPLINQSVFEDVQQRLHSRGPRSTGRHVVRTRHSYALKGLLHCGLCQRRMQGNWNHGRAHYRCRFPNEYALANQIEHPRSVYVREDAILDSLDRWLAQVFAPEHIEQSLQAMHEAPTTRGPSAEEVATQRTLDDCDRKLAQYRSALDAGADPAVVTTWIQEATRQREQAQAQLGKITKPNSEGLDTRMSPDQIKQLADQLGGLLTTLHHAHADDKAEVYRHLGLQLTYEHDTHTVLAHAQPRPPVGTVTVSEGGLEPPRPGGH